MARRVLVTGINGFAGKYLARSLLKQGFEVLGTSHKTATSDAFETEKADLRDVDEIGAIVRRFAPTHVAHLAAISFVGHGNIAEIYDTNIVGTRNLLSALAGLMDKPSAVLLTSSANVYGNSQNEVLRETDLPDPVNDYAVSKIAMEYMARQFMPNLNITVARPFNYTGVGQAENFIIPKIVKHFREKAEILELGNTYVSRDFSDVRTVTEQFSALLQTPQAIGQTYNICSGEAYSLQHIVDLCRDITGHELEIRVNPAFVRANEVRTLMGNDDKYRSEIGPVTAISLEQTLRWMLSEPSVSQTN